jgi:hypothetical protein
MSSADFRLFAKQIVRRPRPTRPASSRDDSPSALARRPSSASRSGGFQSATVRSARGAASSSTTIASSPVSACASSPAFAIVADARQELRLGAVDPREPPQPAEDVRDVRAEDAAVDVRLVHDHEAEVVEEVAPQVVSRQDADVEHVRVRQHEVRPAADLASSLGRRVPVVDRRADRGHAELAERARLVLRERLGRVEVERPRVPVGGERVEHRQVERERLARRGAGRDDHVAAALRRPRTRGLVRVELVDLAPRERVQYGGLERVGERRGSCLTRGLGREVGELVPTRSSSQRAVVVTPPLKRARAR